MTMQRAVAVGEREKILPFKSLGLDLEYADSMEELARVMEKMAHNPDISLVVVSEDLVSGQPDVVSVFREMVHAPIVVLPSHLGSGGTSMTEIGKMVKRAIGVEIIEGGRS
ncbi:MAG: hypothetical protein GY800_13000 [Planctomycetes bacterium]|nr:hypothetical protein [Planctomycetota bacterium]